LSQHKIEGGVSKHEAFFRILSWGTVLLLMATAVFLFILGATGRLIAGSNFGWLFGVLVFAAFMGAIILGCREALHYAEREMIFAIEDDGIVKKREGYPDVKIPFSEIDTLSLEQRWLAVVRNEPRTKIAVPNKVQGYELIRAELAKRHPLSSPAKFHLNSAALLTISSLSWVAVLWFQDVRVVILSGAVALVTLAFGSHRLWILLHYGPKPTLLWVSLCSAWLMAFLLIYTRVFRP
jgi:hypothetical protein